MSEPGGLFPERGVTAHLYVAGPMSGLPGHNYGAFDAAAAALRAAAYVVESPAEPGQVEGWEWVDYMRRGVAQLVRCRGVATLDGWEASKGASIEVGLALSIQMPVRPVGWWLAQREQ